MSASTIAVSRPLPARPRRDPTWLLAAPALIYFALFYALPILWLLAGSITGRTGVMFGSYAEFLSDPFNWRVISNTLRVAALVAVFCLVLGYPVAFALASAPGVDADRPFDSDHSPALHRCRREGVRLADRLRSDGVVSQFMMATGFWSEPQRLLFTEGGLVFGAASVFLPFIILPIYAA